MKKKKAAEEQITQITEILKELLEDSTVPKNVKIKLEGSLHNVCVLLGVLYPVSVPSRFVAYTL